MSYRWYSTQYEGERRIGSPTTGWPRRLSWVFIWAAIIVLAAGCRDRLAPQALGRPYDIVVSGRPSPSIAWIQQGFGDTIPMLPRPERLFRLRIFEPQSMTVAQRQWRNLIIVRQTTGQPSIAINEHTGVDGQITISLSINDDAPDARQKTDSLVRLAATAIETAEMGRALKILRRHLRTDLDSLINRRWQLRIWIPEEFVSEDITARRLWLNDDRTNPDSHIVILRLPNGFDPRRGDLLRLTGIPGLRQVPTGSETDKPQRFFSSWRTAGGETLDEETVTRRGGLWIRGLWKTDGQTMGGPFVARIINTGSHKAAIIGFIFAPGRNKATSIHRIETILLTAEPADKT